MTNATLPNPFGPCDDDLIVEGDHVVASIGGVLRRGVLSYVEQDGSMWVSGGGCAAVRLPPEYVRAPTIVEFATTV